MQFGKLILIGAAIVALAPAAMADILLSGQIETTGTATVKATSIIFANYVATKTSPFFAQSPGAVVAAQTSGSFSAFTTPSSMYYVPGATSTTTNGSGQYTGRAGANLVYSTATLGTPALFYQVIEGGNTLNFYVTSVTSVTVGTTTLHGGLTATGYVTVNGIDMTNGTYTLTDDNPNAGRSTFTSIFTVPPPPPPPPPIVPEPSSLALLGTGMIGIAGFVFRKRGNIQE